MPNDDTPSEAAIEDQLRQAHQALSDAKGARDAELSDTVVVNRLYYACFHAAQAVLYNQEHDPTTHGGVLSLFGSEVVKEGNAARADGRFLNDLGELRQKADYGYGTIDEDIDALLTRTRQFVSEMEALC
ncbi:HEPN domain-containing protein [Halococcus thailandensis]|uniref:HEPN domain-containing protein n=1 Tax=Halococcus thailandensis JCM 13552 TaxID=1227457 RepID=M0NHR1_9EURY|nr:HEPN domain-containing protein [Halococcus thailandensis]EMA56649.1 HEPN domain-containing protein [Halococcus thailandensis JCM 13552]